ncbi:MAG TPA: glycosyltransferase [Rhizomicrobium sp.]|nr:glycosyltransferase [Rhizomicrobium sp.]
MKTAVIIPTFKRPAMIERMLRNLLQSSLPPDTHIVVVENGPICGVEEICAGFRDDRVLYAYLAKSGKAAATNHGIAQSGADFFLFFDDDIGLAPNIVELYVQAARRYGPGYFFGGPLVADAEIPCPPALFPHLPRSTRDWVPANHEMEVEPKQFHFFFGANWAAFRSDLEKVGMFSEDYGVTEERNSPLGEELEIQDRLIKASAKAIYLPGALIRHPVPKECYTLAWVRQRTFRQGLTTWQFSEKSKQAHAYKFFGIPAWIWRAAAMERIKQILSTLCNFPVERKVAIAVRSAYFSGLLYGAWTDGARGGLVRGISAPREG